MVFNNKLDSFTELTTVLFLFLFQKEFEIHCLFER